jgi:hypothetical protein
MRKFFVTLVVVLAVGAHAQNKAGSIELVRGEVLIVDAKGKVVADTSGKRSRKVEVGSDFFVGETFQTKADGRVKLRFLEGNNEVVLGTNTTLLVSRAGDNSGAKGTDLALARGQVRSSVNTKYSGQGSESFNIKTPNAVAGVRGTRFDVHFTNNVSKVLVLEGRVAFGSLGQAKPVFVAPNQFSSVTPGASAEAPRPIASDPAMKNLVQSFGEPAASEPESESSSGSAPAGPSASSGSSGTEAVASGDSGSNKNSDSQAAAPVALGREKVEVAPDSAEGSRAPASQAPPQVMGSSGPGQSAPVVRSMSPMGNLIQQNQEAMRAVNQEQRRTNQETQSQGRVTIRLD